MTAPLSICTQIVLTADKHLDLHDGTDEDTVTIAADTYDDIWALCDTIQTGIRALDGGASAFYKDALVDPCFDGSVPGMIKIDFTVTGVSILWNTGTNTATTIGEVLGFDVSADDSAAVSYTSDYQHQYGWYAVRYPSRYGPGKPEAIGGDMRFTLSSKNAKRVHVAYRTHFDISLIELVPELMWSADATGANANRDLETVWKAIAQGDWFRYREDQEVEATYTDYYLREPLDLYEAVSRPHDDYESYNLSMRWIEKES